MRQADEFPLFGELSKTFHETLIADLEARADAFARARLGRLTEQREDLHRKRIAGRKFGSIGREPEIGSRFCIRQFQR